MAKTIVGLYDDHNDARRAKQALLDNDFNRTKVKLIDRSDDADSITDDLTDAGVPHRDAKKYAAGVRQGGALVVATGEDSKVQSAVSLLNQFNPVDIERRTDLGRGRDTGYSSKDIEGQSYTGERFGKESTMGSEQDDLLMGGQKSTGVGSDMGREGQTGYTGMGESSEQEKLEVAEEKLHVGKRTVEEGGIRARTYVSEKDVEEDVHLREEHIDVERRPVDREVSGANGGAFKEEEIEFTEIREEPVIEKRAHVIEEVIITKDVDERTETVKDTVRRQDVDIERLGKEYDQEFRNDYQQRFSGSNYSYDDYSKGYRYGASLGTHSGYQNREWHEIEPEAREQWESRNKGTWEEFKDSVRHGWEKVRGKGRGEESRPMA